MTDERGAQRWRECPSGPTCRERAAGERKSGTGAEKCGELRERHAATGATGQSCENRTFNDQQG